MTYLQAIKSELHAFPIPSAAIEVKCLKHSIIPTDEYVPVNEVLLVEIELLSEIAPQSGISEGGVNKSYDPKAVERLIKRLCNEAGIDAGDYLQTDSVKFLEDWS
jgi:hypothetical protein